MSKDLFGFLGHRGNDTSALEARGLQRRGVTVGVQVTARRKGTSSPS
jgi:hypothetical protein